MAEYDKYQKYQKYINGVPADPPEYKRGELIGTGEYDSIADCESAAIYEWRVSSESDYICDGYSSYYKEYKYKSLDKGQTWTRTNQIRKGALKSQYATECGWKLLERWVKTGVTRCNGDDLQDEYKKQVSYDMGKTYMDSNPPEFKYKTAEGGEFYKDCVLKREPLIYEITTLEDNVGIWIELFQTSKKYYINWGESENVAEYKLNGELIMLYGSEVSPNWRGCPKNYVFAKAGTYQVKVWVGSVIEFGGVFRTERWTDTVHFKGLKYTDKYTYKIKSWGGRPYGILNGFNFSGTPLTELCDDEQGVFKDSPLNSIGSATPNHYSYSIYSGESGYADYTIQLELGAAFTVYSTLLTEIPPNIFKYANNLAQATLTGTKITSIPDTLFSNCTRLKDINGIFASTNIASIPDTLFSNCTRLTNIESAFVNCTKLTSIPEGLFDGCPNLNWAKSAFENTGITTVPRLWHISSSIDTSRMFYNCKSLVSVADDFGQLTGNKSSMFENCTELTSLGGLTLGRGIMDSMLANTKISELPANLWSNISNGYSAAEMFRDCKELKSVSGVITGNDIGSVQKMFYNSGITSVDIQFPDLLQSKQNTLIEMFAYCKELNTVNNNMFNKNATALYPTRMFMGCVSLTDWIKDGDTNIWDYPAFYEVDNQPHHLQYTYMYLGCMQIIGQIPIEFGGSIGSNTTLQPTIITVSPKEGGNESSIGFRFSGTFNYIDWGDGTQDYDATSHIYKTSGTYTIKLYTDSNQWAEFNDGVGCNYRIENWGTCIPYFQDTPASKATCTYWGEDQYGVMRTMTNIKQLGDSEYIQGVHPDLLKYAENLNGVRLPFNRILVIPPKLFNNCKNLTQIDMLVYENNGLESVDGLFEDYSGNTNMESIITFSTMPRTMNRMFKNSRGLNGNLRMFYYNTWDKLEEAEECFMNSTYTNLEIIKAPSLRKAARMYKGSRVTFDNIQHINSQNIDMTECFANAKMDVEIVFYKYQDDYSVNLTNAFNNCTELTHLPKVTYKDKTYNLWEVDGIIGTGCFKGCTRLLEQYGDQIPDGWK